MAQRWLMFVFNVIIAALAVLTVALGVSTVVSRSQVSLSGSGMVTLMLLSEYMGNVIIMYSLVEVSIGAVGRLHAFSRETRSEENASFRPHRGRRRVGSRLRMFLLRITRTISGT